jgi:hypothetical protein
MIEHGKVSLFDFERFREKDGAVLLTPFPRGKASMDFTLTGFDPAVKRAVFVNEKNDFPSRLTYEVGADQHLEITLEGEQGGEPMRFSLDLMRKKR